LRHPGLPSVPLTSNALSSPTPIERRHPGCFGSENSPTKTDADPGNGLERAAMAASGTARAAQRLKAVAATRVCSTSGGTGDFPHPNAATDLWFRVLLPRAATAEGRLEPRGPAAGARRPAGARVGRRVETLMMGIGALGCLPSCERTRMPARVTSPF